MTNNPYPESKPDTTDIQNFTFSLRNVDYAENDLELQAQAFEDRISKIVEHATVNDIRIVGSILGLTHNANELTMIGRALERVAPLIETLDEIRQKQALLALAKANPSWVAWAFGDFEREIDAAIERLDQSHFE